MLPLPAFVGGFGPLELGVLLVVLIFLFGARRIPDLANAVGGSIGELKKGQMRVEKEAERIRKELDGKQ